MDYSLLGFNNTKTNLNLNLISKLKQTDLKNIIDPIENQISSNTRENSFINDLKSQINGLKNIIEGFNVNIDNNVFNKKAATIDGDSVVFKSTNDSLLKEETYKINVSQLAQKDVYQSNKFIDKSGKLSFDSSVINNNYNEAKELLSDLFIGTINNKGIFSKLNDFLDKENNNGILSN